MTDASKSTQKATQDYKKPQLVVFGEFSKLTAAGSAGVPEAGAASSNKIRP